MLHDDVRLGPESAQLNLGGRRTEILLIGGLAAVILGAIALTVFYAMDWNIGSTAKAVAECQSCRKRFEYDPDDDLGARIGGMVPGSEPYRLDCPKCGKKASALPLTLCLNPDCGKRYLSPKIEYDRKIAQGAAPETLKPPDTICPHCGTDRMKWLREQFRKEHGEKLKNSRKNKR